MSGESYAIASLLLAVVALSLHFYAEYTRKPKFHNIYDFKEAWSLDLDKNTEKLLIGLLTVLIVIILIAFKLG